MALGFHRFFRSTETETPPSAEIGDYEKALDLAQIVSGMIIAYMVEMGVDARVFTEASTKGRDELMRFERAAAEELGILTPHAFSRWFIEPYNGGIIAASRRQIPTHAYSLVTQATLYCSNGQATIMLTAPEATWLGADDFFANQGAWIYWQHPSGEVERENIPKSRVAVSTDDNGAQIRIRLSRDDVAAAVRATSFEVQLSVPRASGGFWFGRSLLENDGELLRSATTHCI